MAHSFAAGALNDDYYTVSRHDAERIGSAVVEMCEELGVDLGRYSRAMAVGTLATVVTQIEAPKIQHYLSRPKTQRAVTHNDRAAAVRPTPVVPRPDLYVPAQPIGGAGTSPGYG